MVLCGTSPEARCLRSRVLDAAFITSFGVSEFLYFIVEVLLLFEVAHFVEVGLVVEILLLLESELLPLLPDLLHHLECSHVRVLVHDLGTRLQSA